MPLASNAMMKKSVPKQPLRCNTTSSNVADNPRTIINGPIKTTRRDSISSCGSNQSNTGSIKNNSHHHNHLSLPKSVPSTTIMTKSKVEHRRRSISTMKNAKENQYHDTIPKHIVTTSTTTTPPNKKRNQNDSMMNYADDDTTGNTYSPPETRSAKKLKQQINTNFFNTNHNALLQFSPPNHIKNQLIESERIQQKEKER
jgi:hypothetical protein